MPLGRNDFCLCGSGKKYKLCCGGGTVRQSPSPAEFQQLAALFSSGRHAELEHHARTLLARFPETGLVWKLLCIALQMQGKDALNALQNAAKRLPDDAEIHNNLGLALQTCGRVDEALASYRRAIVLVPNEVAGHANLGNAQRDMGDLHDAVASYRKALELNPNVAEIHNNLGAVLSELLQFDLSRVHLSRALELNPNYAAAYNNLGNLLRDLGRFADAETCFRQALAIQPVDAEARNNLGALLRMLGRADEAIACTRQALAVKPDDATAHMNLAHLLLERGEFEQGWREYEWREPRRAVEWRVPLPLPRAAELLPFSANGKRILLCHEQGIGDELFFLRFAPKLRQGAAWAGYWSTPKVRSLIERAGCVDQVFGGYEESPPADIVIPVGDLPLLLGCNSVEMIPPSLRFSPLPAAVEQVRQCLNESDLIGQRLLGVTWRGGNAPVPGKTRSLFKLIDLEVLVNAVQGWNGAIVILQREPKLEEIEQLRASVSCPVHDFSEYNDDLELMLALLSELTDYVGVSNANMHLMAGLGRTARVLVPAPAEWRWMEGVTESPWFPGFTLYRQSFNGKWDEAMQGLMWDLQDSLQ